MSLLILFCLLFFVFVGATLFVKSQRLSFRIRLGWNLAGNVLQVNTHGFTELDFWLCHTFKMAAMTFARRLLLHVQQHLWLPASPPSVWRYWLTMCYSSWSMVHSNLLLLLLFKQFH